MSAPTIDLREPRVEGHGPLECQIALVGEAPGDTEVEHYLPFIGPSGKLLSNDIFAKAGIRRKVTEIYIPGQGTKYNVESEVYTTNTVKVYPGKTEKAFEKRFYSDSKCKHPTVELLGYYEELKEELSKCSANIIIACGNHALRALCNRTGITNWAGSILESTLLPGRKVMPMIHPASILREWYWRTFCLFDAKRAKAQSAFPEIRRRERTFVIAPTLEQVLEAEAWLIYAPYLAFDIETKANHITCISFAPSPDWAICVPLARGSAHYWPDAATEARVWLAIYRILTAPSKKIAQNGLYDMSHLATHGVPVANMWFDTMLAQSILYPELEKSLAVLTHLYTEEVYHKGDGRRAMKAKGGNAEKSWDISQADVDLWNYCCKDSAYDYQIAFEQIKEFREFDAAAVKGRIAA